ncbi:MAG: sporulation protein YunB [Candidatus Merdivicinus sp.]|jgi:sporulation protein YunB
MGLRHRRKRRGNPAVWILAVVLMAGGLFYATVEKNLRPVAVTMAEYRSRVTAETAMNQGIEDVVASFAETPLVAVSRSQEGEIQAVEVNMQAVNLLKLQVTGRILQNLQQAGQRELKIPLGSLLGSGLLSGKGPPLTYRFLPEGSVSTRILSRFESCGINQTRHQVLLSVEVKAGAILSQYRVDVEVPTEYVLAETVLVGSVPESYTHVLTDDQELLGEINDYKAGE